MAMNRICLTGALVAEPRRKRTVGDKDVVYFIIAVPRSYKKPGEKYARADYISCRVWGLRSLRLIEYVEVGDWIGVVGRLMVDTWEADGVKKTFCYVHVDEINFLRARGQNWAGRIPSKENLRKIDTGKTSDEKETVDIGELGWSQHATYRC